MPKFPHCQYGELAFCHVRPVAYAAFLLSPKCGNFWSSPSSITEPPYFYSLSSQFGSMIIPDMTSTTSNETVGKWSTCRPARSQFNILYSYCIEIRVRHCTGGTADCFGSHFYTLTPFGVIQFMALLVMYFAGKEQQSLAICDFVHHGYYAPGVFYLYQVLLDRHFVLCGF